MSNRSKTVSLFDSVKFYKATVDKGSLKDRMIEILETEKSNNRSVQKSNQGASRPRISARAR